MILKNSAAKRQRQQVFSGLLYTGLCNSYGTERMLAEKLPGKGFSDVIDYYKLVVLAHIQKSGNIFGHLDLEGKECEDGVISALLTYLDFNRDGGESTAPASLLALIRIAYLKAAHYRTLSLYADHAGLPMAGSILRRMYAEECEGTANLLAMAARL